MNSIIVRPLDTGEYEVFSGHRRLHACKKAGIDMIPAFVCSMDRSEAVVAIVDSNLHREKLLLSKKAFAYKMKMDVLNHQGQTCGKVGLKSRDTVSETESGRQIQQYIPLTNLIPSILQMADSGAIALTPAVELSYLDKKLQEIVLDAMLQEDRTPSYSQTARMKNLYNRYQLDVETIYEIMAEDKANQREKINFRVDDLRHSYPAASIRSGDDIKTVQDNLGDATAAFTLDVYGHVTQQMKQESANQMEQFFKAVNA